MTGPGGAAPAALTAAYEELRAWAGGQPRPGPRPPGLALCLRFGVPTWLAAATTRLPRQPAYAASPGAGQGAGLPVAAGADLTLVLAAMVAACHQEVWP